MKKSKYPGVICSFCNTYLGYMNESPEMINKLLQYAKFCQRVKTGQLPTIQGFRQ